MRPRSKIANDLSPAELCAACVGDALLEKPVTFLERRGTIALQVEGDRALTIRFGDKKKPIELDCADDGADFRLECSRDVLAEIVAGTIDAPRALQDGTLRLSGNLDLLEALVSLMERGKSMLSLRAGR